MISSYSNFVSLQWQFGYQLYIPFKAKRELEKVFENVTFPTIESLKKCKIKSKKWTVSEDMTIFLQNIFDCIMKNKGHSQTSCLPSTSGRTLNVKINRNHNVRA